MSDNGLRFEGVAFAHSPVGEPILRDVTFRVERSELVVVVGASGSGKSTLLRLVAGLAEPTSGDLFFDGESLRGRAPRDRDVGMVFQDYALYPHLTVRENLAFPLRARKLDASVIASRVGEIAARLHLAALLERRPRDLSGGQRQRVALGRLLVRTPRLALFDEPLSNLDVALRRELRAEIRALHQNSGWTTLYVTHDPTEAAAIADRIAVLRDGVVVQCGSYSELSTQPRHREVVSLLMPLANLSAADQLPASWRPAEGAHEVALHADDLTFASPAADTITATCLGPLDQGSSGTYAVVRTSWGAQWIVRGDGTGRVGHPVDIALEASARTRAFSRDGVAVDGGGGR